MQVGRVEVPEAPVKETLAAIEPGLPDTIYVAVFSKAEDGTVKTHLLQPAQVDDVADVVNRISRTTAYSRPKRMKRTSPVIVRKVDPESFFAQTLEVNDFFASVADFNEAIGFDRFRTQTHRQLQSASNRQLLAEFPGGVYATFASAEEVERARERGFNV